MSAFYIIRWIAKTLLTIFLMSHVLFAQEPGETAQQKKRPTSPSLLPFLCPTTMNQ
jgi:hypothetical protein